MWKPIAFSLMVLAGWPIAAFAESAVELATALRRPVALIANEDALIVGNRASGTLTVIDPKAGRILGEFSVASQIADVLQISNGQLLVIDDAQGQLRKVSLSKGRASVATLADLPAGPAKLAWAPGRRTVFVSATWSREVVSLTLTPGLDQVTNTQLIPLAFAPRELLLLGGDRTLLVADAFGPRLAIVDAQRGKLKSARRIKGHNIRGLATDPVEKELYVAHQQMSHRDWADYDAVHWGQLVANTTQVFNLDQVLAGSEDAVLEGWMDTQGDIGNGAADPSAVITGPSKLVAVALAGINEVAVRRAGYSVRVPVQTRPEAMAVSGERLFVANRFDDSVSVIDLRHGRLAQTISLGPMPKLNAVQRGERLFFDAQLSHDNWMSCHSCHTDGHTSGLLVDTLGDGDYGAPKRVPSLLGTGDTAPWAWNGAMKTLAQQVRKSVTTTMHGHSITDRQTADLVAYLKSLKPPPRPTRSDDQKVLRGRSLFESRGCAECHQSPAYTSRQTYDVGLVDERGRSAFNPPSLRGVAHRNSFFHDGRYSSLDGVLVKERHQLEKPLSKAELAELLAFLRSL